MVGIYDDSDSAGSISSSCKTGSFVFSVTSLIVRIGLTNISLFDRFFSSKKHQNTFLQKFGDRGKTQISPVLQKIKHLITSG